jgi:hypothetical protein
MFMQIIRGIQHFVFLGVKAEMLLDIKENKITISTFMNELA